MREIQQLRSKERVTRDEIQELALQLREKEDKVLLTFATRVGKSRTALNLVEGSLLVIVPTNYIKKHTWEPLLKDYPHKWKVLCWASVKNVKNEWDSVILDELHNLTPTHLPFLKALSAIKWIGLTATLPYEKSLLWSELVGKYYHWDISLQQAIDWEILPKPEIFVYKIKLDDKEFNQWYPRGNNKGKKDVYLEWSERFQSHPNCNVHIKCTEVKWMELLEGNLDYWKKQLTEVSNVPMLGIQRQLQNLGNKRKQFFVSVKTKYYQELRERLKFGNKRYIVFTGSIEQANVLGKENVVHSLNPDTDKVFQRFLDGEINHVYSVHMIDEGLEMGNLDFSVIIQGTLGGKVKGETEAIQRLGRTLTSVSPKCLVLVIEGTKDEKFVEAITKLVRSEYVKQLQPK